MPERYIGLMSGTSLDGVDAVLIETSHDHHFRITHTHTERPDPALRTGLLEAGTGSGNLSLLELGQLHQRTGLWFAGAANRLVAKAGLASSDIRAIGSHGQTLYHAPNAPFPFSLQCGDGNTIAARTGITTVADFRQADIVAGGQGAPLVPAFHQTAFGSDDETRCVVNIGGIANITVLPAADSLADVTGFDTGPGNCLLDSWAEQNLGEPQDTNARWATSGNIDTELLARLRGDGYFQQPPPKSTGREKFNLSWLNEHVSTLGHPAAPANIQRTLLELTAKTIAQAIREHAHQTSRVLLCGGGAHNPLLREQIRVHLPGRALADTDAYGIHADWVEGAAFAWLAMRAMNGLPGNLPSVTGASKPVVLGGIYRP